MAGHTLAALGRPLPLLFAEQVLRVRPLARERVLELQRAVGRVRLEGYVQARDGGVGQALDCAETAQAAGEREDAGLSRGSHGDPGGGEPEHLLVTEVEN